MPVMIKLQLTSGSEVYFNASLISVIYQDGEGTIVQTKEGRKLKCIDSPETIDRKIDKQIWNLLSDE